jgi:hypothetical protein
VDRISWRAGQLADRTQGLETRAHDAGASWRPDRRSPTACRLPSARRPRPGSRLPIELIRNWPGWELNCRLGSVRQPARRAASLRLKITPRDITRLAHDRGTTTQRSSQRATQDPRSWSAHIRRCPFATSAVVLGGIASGDRSGALPTSCPHATRTMIMVATCCGRSHRVTSEADEVSPAPTRSPQQRPEVHPGPQLVAWQAAIALAPLAPGQLERREAGGIHRSADCLAGRFVDQVDAMPLRPRLV